MSQPEIKAVVFDLDGLMFNTEDVFNLSGHELLRRRGKEMTHELLTQMMGRRAHEAFQAMVEMHDMTESIDDLLAESGDIFKSLLEDHLAPMPGLYQIFEVIESKQLPKAVATSSSRPYLHDILGRFDLLSRFELTLTAEDVTHGKPHPEIYQTAAEKLQIAPEEMMVFEDSEAGTKSAAAAGAIAISVPHEHSKSHNFDVAYMVADALNDPRVFELLGVESA